VVVVCPTNIASHTHRKRSYETAGCNVPCGSGTPPGAPRSLPPGCPSRSEADSARTPRMPPFRPLFSVTWLRRPLPPCPPGRPATSPTLLPPPRLDKGPLLPGCGCFACRRHSRAYVHHMLNTHEMLADVLLEAHNTSHVMAFCQVRAGWCLAGVR
jgi:hypothetical protein